MKKAILFEPLNDKKVKCLACSWYCHIDPGHTGICGTRLNKNGILYSIVYGKAIGLHIDPVEKKPLYHFLPGSHLLSFGTVGCNFGCLFCQNWEQSQLIKRYIKHEDKKAHISMFSTNVSPKEIVELALKHKVEGIAYTYNEPAIFAEYTHDTAVLAKEKGLKNVYVSNGFESNETFEYIKDYIDAINIDLKSFKSEFYAKICKAKPEVVMKNIKKYYKAGIEIEVTTLVIPGYNDSSSELTEIAGFIKGVSVDIPWHVTAFHPNYLMHEVPQTPHSTLDKAYEIGKKSGLKYVYAGNVLDIDKSKTYCPKCGEILIKRDDYNGKVVHLDINSGKCKKCQEVIYGVWN